MCTYFIKQQSGCACHEIKEHVWKKSTNEKYNVIYFMEHENKLIINQKVFNVNDAII